MNPIDPLRPFSPTEISILEGFLKFANEEGVAEATLEKVAKASKISFGTVRYHFAKGNKLSLVQSAIVYIYQSGYQFFCRLPRPVNKERSQYRDI